MKGSLQTAMRVKKLGSAGTANNISAAFTNEWRLYEAIFKYEKYPLIIIAVCFHLFSDM